MLKLYGSAQSRASIVQWYLEEIAIPYEFVKLDMQAGEHRQPAYLAINPIGKVPAIVDGDFHLWESGAILLYLAQKYGEEKLSSEEYAQLAQWVLFANATLGPGIFQEASREREMPRLLTSLNAILEQNTFVMGNNFTVADVAVGAILAYTIKLLKLDLSSYPSVMKYIKQLAERPAFQKSIGS